MINVSCFKLLSDPKRISPNALRIFMCLGSKLDLTHLRTLPLDWLMTRLDITSGQIKAALRQLTTRGLLIEGPKVFVAKKCRRKYTPDKLPVYRLNPAFMLSHRDFLLWLNDIEELADREELIPDEAQTELRSSAGKFV